MRLASRPTPSAPYSEWTSPPAMMPEVAARPAMRPRVNALASTKIMSMPGTTIMPKRSVK